MLFVQAEPAHAPLVRAVAAAAYRRGATFVDAFYFDPWVKRARIAYAPEDTLEFVPPWYSERILALGEQRCARLWITGSSARGLFDDLDAARAGRDLLPRLKETGRIVNDRTTNWTIVPYPTAAWAAQVTRSSTARRSRNWSTSSRTCSASTSPIRSPLWYARFRDTKLAAARP